MNNLQDKSVFELLSLHVDAITRLRELGVLRTGNVPTGDLGERLFCDAFEWQQARNSEKAYDAVNKEGLRYQVKARRLYGRHRSRQLSAIRSPDGVSDT